MLDRIPQEVLNQFILGLERPDLKQLRLVNRALEVRVTTALFRSFSVSLLTLDRLRHVAEHPKISVYVEELWYEEMDLTGVATAPGVDQSYPIRYLTNTILQYIAHSKNLHISPTISLWQEVDHDPHYDGLDEFAFERPEGPPGNADEDSELTQIRDELRQVIPNVIESYTQKAALQNSGHLQASFKFAFERLPNLRRIVCADSADGVTSGYLPIEENEHLSRLNDIFPVTDASLRNTFRAYQSTWPGHGFLGVWGALGGSDHFPNIQHLEIRRDENLFVKRGIPLSSIDSALGDDVSVEAFCQLRSLNLCLEVDLRPHTWSRKLLAALAGASHLRKLEISLTSMRSHADMNLTDVLPMTPLPELRSVILEGFFFSTEDICQFLFTQTKLKNVSLRRPVLYGSWVALLNLWSARAGFMLDSIELKHVLECEVLREEHFDKHRCQVPSQPSTDALLHCVNHGGDNPFEDCRWKESERLLSDFEDAFSDFSDTSDWLPEEHPDPVEDSDGPEFDEDYDFDAEDDSDMDMDLAKLQVEGDGDDAGEESDIEMIDSQ